MILFEHSSGGEQARAFYSRKVQTTGVATGRLATAHETHGGSRWNVDEFRERGFFDDGFAHGRWSAAARQTATIATRRFATASQAELVGNDLSRVSLSGDEGEKKSSEQVSTHVESNTLNVRVRDALSRYLSVESHLPTVTQADILSFENISISPLLIHRQNTNMSIDTQRHWVSHELLLLLLGDLFVTFAFETKTFFEFLVSSTFDRQFVLVQWLTGRIRAFDWRSLLG